MFWHGGVGLSPTLLVSLVANSAGRNVTEMYRSGGPFVLAVPIFVNFKKNGYKIPVLLRVLILLMLLLLLLNVMYFWCEG